MRKLTAYSLVWLGCVISNYAYSSDGVVQFTGSLTEESCDLSVNGNGTSEGTVIIPAVKLTELTGPGNAEKTAFSIGMRNCAAGNYIRPHFESDNSMKGYLENTTSPENGGADNILLAIYNEEGTRLEIGSYISDDKIPFKPVAGNEEVVFNYSVALTGSDASATTGRVTSALVYSIEYQ